MKLLLIAGLLFGFASVTSSKSEQADQSVNMEDRQLVHTVFFWLKDKDSETDAQKLYEGLKMIKDIPEVMEGYIGVPAVAGRSVIDGSYDFSITFIFEDQEAEQAYQVHPDHLKFVDEYSSLWERVIVYDAVSPER
ncbi:MAG: Dabb family protein [Balneolales bacterium]